MQDSSSDPDQEAEARRQAQLEKRHLETYRNMHRLRDAVYRRYAALLRDKVQSQRLLLQQRDETARAKSHTEPKQKQKKLAFSKLQHNDSYLKSLPKTSYHLIFDLQRQLAERGHMKTHHDLEDFYRCIKYDGHPSQLQRSLQDIRKKMLESRSAADFQDKTSEKHPCTAEERGHEDDVCHSRLLERRSGSGESSAELIFRGSREKDAIEEMFPKMLPGLNSKPGKTRQPPLRSLNQSASVHNDRPSCPQQLSRTSSASHQRFETTEVLDTAVRCRKTPEPLSIEDVCQQKHIQIIDRGFKPWRNYTENTDH
ncbi:uncharacterized protein si:ch211-130h14.4 isoform X2 [Seriola aureovittata]|uniref:uncharacterized protein si:ch211-130h14.4 isoform X2 n=1 Tax=Seriola aureovittata TaxID=2871759 RepID=UPI0024BDCEB6|nr:uncharacterized protein si:ch211-130h14.4 isoform X2 [Seriola aureovittata]